MIYCYGAAARSWPADTPLAPLKKELGQHSGVQLRRASAFGVYALAGALACVQSPPVGRDCALYLSTRNGTVAETMTGLREVWHQNALPLPFNFINLAPGSSLFYLQEALGARGFATLFSSQSREHFALALQSALFNLQSGQISEALVGYIDEGYEGLSELLGYTEPLEHVSGWIHLGALKEGAQASVEFSLGSPQREEQRHSGSRALASVPLESIEVWLKANRADRHVSSFDLSVDKALLCRFTML